MKKELESDYKEYMHIKTLEAFEKGRKEAIDSDKTKTKQVQ